MVEVSSQLKGNAMIHSRFSPASMPAELLEHTFVQREDLANRLMDLFTESALTQSKHHVLLVGPRGIGKSHLISLTSNRLKGKEQLKNRLVIASLREDEWGVTSILDLLLRILRAIGTDTTGLSNLSSSKAEQEAWKLLRQCADGKTLLVVLENLDLVLSNLGDEGQMKWRSLIQTYPFWTILATTPALSSDISKRTSPFYGFFEIQNLEGLSVSEAITLLERLARSQGCNDIAQYVTSPAGRARVRAVQHLANGNHRVFVIFYDFLSDHREEVLTPLLKTIDTLSPYYQSQMKELSPQQRKLIEFLCEYRSAANVKTIASNCFVSHQTATSQLKQLLETRYVRVTRIGRESYYELNEPLLRICVEAKSRDGEPLRLLVEFLRYWFSRQEIEERLGSMDSNLPKRKYFEAALREYDNPQCHRHLSPDVGKLCGALGLAIEQVPKDKDAVTATAQELAKVSEIAEDWAHYAIALGCLGGARQALPLLIQKAEQDRKDRDLLYGLAMAYEDDGQLAKAISALEEALALKPDDSELWHFKGIVLEKSKDYVAALESLSQAARITPTDATPLQIAQSRVLSKMRKYSDAEGILKPLLGKGQKVPGLLVQYGCILRNAGKVSQALPYFDKATRAFPNDAEAQYFKARVLLQLNRLQEAMQSIESALKMDPNSFPTQVIFSEVLINAGEEKRALRTLPVGAVAHSLFHKFLEVVNTKAAKKDICANLLRFKSLLKAKDGIEVVLGAVTEFTNFVVTDLSIWDAPILRDWNDAISKAFHHERKFAMVLKIFDVITRYKESNDERVLLELPLEQRSLLTPTKEQPKTIDSPETVHAK